MFTMVRRFIKTGLAFLGIGLLLGGYLLVRRELEGVFPDRYLVSAHVHAVGVGFVMFMILGVALWLFPKPTKEDTRYQPARIELAYWILVTSTGTRFLTEITRASLDATWLRVLVLAAGFGQIVGLAIYFYTMWTRIRPVGSHLREARGERF
jgi:heme/copper-type cytochrome/quinol oxidase subunit 1